MSAENRTLSRRWFEEVWNERRADAIDELLSPEGVGHMESGDFVGVEPFRQVRDQFIAAFPDLRFEIEDMVADGDAVVVRWNVRGTHTGEGLGIAPCHRPVTARGMTWHRFHDGVMVEGWDAWNQGAFFQHLQEAPAEPVASDETILGRRAEVAARIREVREDRFGATGGPEAARRLGLPVRTWYNYETGVAVPAEVLLAFLDLTGVEPAWLLTGEGPMYRGDRKGSES
ncbi:ester cyclase [Paludisphaera mucosa]|uniref:Ester cyclase n=1 Tax=Paludisphaera mucosa TaxID=3030827 RepID=A0ABT6FFH4_9BACT|nr:ester cyclase [Paludisphaera mucosa]MDG3006148.1 ester cyclase [Paludisphaera mucosa]